MQLPFIAASLAGILFMYRFALAWTGASAALAVAALMATLQYTVLYGQYARPYAIGLATAALLADQATRWLACHRTKHLVAAAIAATLCAFTHHFAALVAALIMAGTLVVAVSGRRGNWLGSTPRGITTSRSADRGQCCRTYARTVSETQTTASPCTITPL